MLAAAGDTLAGVLILIVLVALYFVPTAIAVGQKHHNAAPIAIINFFLGWTLIGWVVALAMAVSTPKPRA